VIALVTASAPSSAQAARRGHVLVANQQSANASLIDLATDSMRFIDVGTGPHEAVIAPSGRVGVVTIYGTQTPGNELAIIDIRAGALERKISLGQYTPPHGAMFVPGDESRVVVTSEATQNIVLVNIESGTVEGAIPTSAQGSHMVGLTRDGSRAWTFEAKGLATRAVDTNLYVHLNAAAVVVDRLEEQARRLRYRLALGPSWIVPSMATVLVAGDVYAEQGIRRDEATTVGLEIGFRHRIGGGVDWHGAVGTEVAGAATRATLTVTTGLSFGFTLLGR